MNVYVVIGGYKWEGGYVEKIFYSRPKAEAYKNKLVNSRKKDSFDYYTVIEREVE